VVTKCVSDQLKRFQKFITILLVVVAVTCDGRTARGRTARDGTARGRTARGRTARGRTVSEFTIVN
jgi:hypothetical protein